MSHTYGNCLLGAIASIEPACVMNFASTQTQSHNGISAAESNSNMQHDSQRPTDTSFRLCHYLAQNIEEYAKVNERWLCRQGFPDGGGHWWAVSFDLSGNAPVVDVQARDFVLLLKNIDLEKSCRKFDNITWFRLARCPHEVHLPVDGPYALSGSARSSGAGILPLRTVTPCARCATCGGTLAEKSLPQRQSSTRWTGLKTYRMCARGALSKAVLRCTTTISAGSGSRSVILCAPMNASMCL